jgi:hypothetical protein
MIVLQSVDGNSVPAGLHPREAAEEAVRQTMRKAPSQPKAQALLNLLSQDTSKPQAGASTSGASNSSPQGSPWSPSEEALIAETMRNSGWSREETIKRLVAYGGL